MGLRDGAFAFEYGSGKQESPDNRRLERHRQYAVAAHTGAPHHAHYAAAKAGIVYLTKSAARG